MDGIPVTCGVILRDLSYVELRKEEWENWGIFCQMLLKTSNLITSIQISANPKQDTFLKEPHLLKQLK